MPLSRERTPRERDTLIFDTPEQAQKWRERVEGRVERVRGDGVDRRREVLREAITEEFAREGESAGNLRTPWEHTQVEHTEVQRLVDVAFAQDLAAAIREARKSPHYPRNLDLLHDVLTGEMYHLVEQRGLRRQPAGWWVVVALTIVGLALLLAAAFLR